jgi:hypothetical protein
MSVFTLTVHQYVYYRRRAHRQKQSVGKTLVGNLWSVGECVRNKHIDGFTNGHSTIKKLPASSYWYLYR